MAKLAPVFWMLSMMDPTGYAKMCSIMPQELDSCIGVAVHGGLCGAGLMTIGPTATGVSERERSFTTLRRMVDEMGLSVCSMGMSDDFVQAVECGSTMVRVGSRLFGQRLT